MSLKSLISAGGIITLGILAGRVLGLLRETLIAASFGTGTTADVAIMLLIIPDFVTNVLIGAAASAALIPAFASRDHIRALKLFWQALAVSVVTFTAITIVILLFKTPLLRLLSDAQAAVPQAGLAFGLAMWAIPLSAATAILTAYLQFRGRFTAPAFANAIFTIVILLGLFLSPGLGTLAIAIIAGAILRLLAHLGAFWRTGDAEKPSFLPWELHKPIVKAYGEAATSGAFSVLPQYVPYAVVTAFGSSVALFNYAFKLVLMPCMLLQMIIQMALLPWLVKMRAAATGPLGNLHSLCLQLGWIFAFAISLALMLSSQAVAHLCFGYGRMTPGVVSQVGSLFAVGIWALPGFVLTVVWQQIFYANQRTREPLLASTVQALLSVPMGWLCYRADGVEGVLVSYALLLFLTAFLLDVMGRRCRLIEKTSFTPYIAATLASLAAFLPLALVYRWLALPPLEALLFAIVIGTAVLAAGLASLAPVRAWVFGRRIKTILITNDPVLAAEAQAAGVNRIMVDLESIGKKERQASRKTFISTHTIDDVAKIRAVLSRAQLIVRINPWHGGSKAEIDQAVVAGADFIMLPMIERMDDFNAFISTLAGRVKPLPLIETKYSMEHIGEIAANPAVSEVYIGFNDLHLSLGLDFLFEPLALGLVDEMKSKLGGKPFGFGGIAALGGGDLPAKSILGEHARLGSGCVILSSAFGRDINIAEPAGRAERIKTAVDALQENYDALCKRSEAQKHLDSQNTFAIIRLLAEKVRAARL